MRAYTKWFTEKAEKIFNGELQQYQYGSKTVIFFANLSEPWGLAQFGLHFWPKIFNLQDHLFQLGHFPTTVIKRTAIIIVSKRMKCYEWIKHSNLHSSVIIWTLWRKVSWTDRFCKIAHVLSIKQCCGSGSGSGRTRNFLKDPDPDPE